MTDEGAPPGARAPLDPASTVRSRAYLSALVLAALLGIPVSAIAYGFLALVAKLQAYLFTDLPNGLFDGPTPAWWPVPWLMLSGLLVALTITHLPGTAGHSPALGLHVAGGPAADRDLPGIVLAALATLGLGAVLGPEGPLIAIGGGLAALTVRLAKRDAPPMAVTIMASAGSFAAISTLLGSPLLGAFLIMEAAGIAGATLSLVALPGLLASGIGALVFVGLDAWTGLGTFSLALTSVPPGVAPTVASLLWAVPVGVLAALLGWAIRWVGLTLRPLVHRSRTAVTVGLGLGIGLCATAYQLITGRGFAEVLFSGQSALPGLVANAAGYSVGVLVLLGVFKALAYGLSLAAFRGGPVFPAMFVGAVLGIALSHLPGMELAPAIGTGIGAMCCAMLRLPLTSVLLATLLMGSDGLPGMPQVIVAVVVSFVVTLVLPTPGPKEGLAQDAAQGPTQEVDHSTGRPHP
ncbi:chloride channel protein [Terrabacter sp. BE26]|uniref:chloride channel protein n=1 Tax=Terrabacter sp. BE26 TaxID=2898152 RepID=UPI0035BE94D3